MIWMILVFFGLLTVAAHAWIDGPRAYGLALAALALLQAQGMAVYAGAMRRAERDKMSLVHGNAKTIKQLRREEEARYHRAKAREGARRGGV